MTAVRRQEEQQCAMKGSEEVGNVNSAGFKLFKKSALHVLNGEGNAFKMLDIKDTQN